MEINTNRLAETLVSLCEIDSPSRHEKPVFDELKRIFSDLGADEIVEDASGQTTGSDCGNLIVRFKGSGDKQSLFFNAHMDTVEPAIGVQVICRDDVFYSEGDTVLGGDDKSGIAAMIEAIRNLKDQQREFRPVEFIFTTCEEIGLLGAKAIDRSLVRSRMGYSLDSSGSNRVVIGAPAANRITVNIVGAAAHAGLNPEKGINAIILAAKALAKAPAGRIDEETTVNFGTVHGGVASNIVAEKVTLAGEVRSHSEEKLSLLTTQLSKIFEEVVNDPDNVADEAEKRPSVSIDIFQDFPLLRLTQDDDVVKEIDYAARQLGIELTYVIAGGGSDANIFNSYGLQTAIISTGMQSIHSTSEYIKLQDLVGLTQLVMTILLQK